MGIVIPSQLTNSVQGMRDPSSQIQQAGFDLTVKSIETFTTQGFLSIDNSERVLPKVEELQTSKTDCYDLSSGGYIVRYNESVHIPLDAAGLTLPRSTLMRLGATIHSALWDPGYKGKGMGLLTVSNPVRIEKNSRIAQIIFFSLSSAAKNGYSGRYQSEGLS